MTNLAKNGAAGGSAADAESPPLPTFDFDTPDEASMQLLEEGWRRFCGTVGLREIPDLRTLLAAHDAKPPRPQRKSHWLVRPFVAVYSWLNTRF